jgi:hypothetical protein
MRCTLLTALALGCLSASSLAQSARDERPSRPDARGDPNQPREVRPLQSGPMRTEKGAYLGVSTTPAPQVLRQQLALPRGVGLVVDSVAPRSPAEQAGLKEFDVLHKLNDQLLVNQQQLAVLVRTFKPSDTIKLTVFRDGTSMELSAKLEERDLPPLEQMRLGMDGGFGGGAFGGGVFDPFRGDGGPNPLPPGEMRPGFPGGRAFDPTRPFAPGNMVDEQFDMVWDDGKIQMHVTAKDGKRQLVARNKEGKELYNGPIDTEEQIKGLPQEVRERLPQIGPGMFRFGPNNRRGGQRPDGEGNRPSRDRIDGDRGGDRPSTRPSTRDGEGGRKVDRRNDI